MEENESVVQEVDNVGPIQRYYHEQEVSRLELHNKRLFWALIMTIVFLVASNVGWLVYESQFEDIKMTQEATTDGGGDAVVNGVAAGDLYYGSSEADHNGETP